MEGCCMDNHPKKTALQQNITRTHFRVVKGETFLIPCNNTHKVVCSRVEGEGKESLSFDCGRQQSTEEKHSGNYTCLLSDSEFHLQVVEKTSLLCSEPEETQLTLEVAKGGKIPCPGLSCYSRHVLWYKNNKDPCEKRACDNRNGVLTLLTVSEHDSGVYFCDRQITEQGVMWTFRRAVHVQSIPRSNPVGPRILYPADNMTEIVELGQNHTLRCKVDSPFVKDFLPKVQWYMNYNGNIKNMTELPMESPEVRHHQYEIITVLQKAIITEVTSLHLNHTYTCIARNTFGNKSATVKLKEKIEVNWPSLVGYPIASFLLVAGLGIVLRVKWLELQLIYRTHFQRGKLNGDEKEFDVLLSYVWSPPSAEVEGGLTLSSTSRPSTEVKSCLSSPEPLNMEEGNTQRAPEVLLRQVLEDQWGYRLCLLERDMVPGEAYTNDVVHAIQRSKMLICLLSDDYLSNNDALFVLESGVQALLQNSAPKVLLIWTSRTSTSLIQPDPPLPSMVQRALKVLPSLNWTLGKPARATSNFLRSLRKALANHRVEARSNQIVWQKHQSSHSFK
ncbi:interleukin-18 receptor accessory protein-like [Scomber japonicus]|uniref:interleukin-18 receptor accessory protein-like n=1 Tax=Scomber japonicus TaxID=13676 RepID=UPI00230686AE|nr:interleukin-18 receptor accessory protein-like [Scomber japonicus]